MSTYRGAGAWPPENSRPPLSAMPHVEQLPDEDETLVLPAMPHTYGGQAADEGDTAILPSRPGESLPPSTNLKAPKARKGRRKRRRIVAALLLVSVLLVVAAGAVDGFNRLSRVRAEMSDGMRHLKNIEALLPSSKGGLGEALNAVTLQKASVELKAAEHDFAALRVDLGDPGGTVALASHLPKVNGLISTGAALAAAADEACLAGLDLVNSGQTALEVLKGGFFASSASTAPKAPPGTPPAPTLNTQTLTQLQGSFDNAMIHLNAAVAYAQNADLSVLPSQLVKPSQITQLRGLIANWPAIRQQLAQVDGWLTVAPVILGAAAPEHLLLVMMDRSELRATGGFMGNYAVATIQNGKVQPFSLEDTYFLDYPYIAHASGPLAPPAAYSWWPYPNFALRDSNLSADFPTSAQLAMHELQIEGGGTAQGMVAFTPVAIEDVMKVVGNIAVPEYGEVATPANLETLIHKYQELSKQTESTRKHFTALLAQHLLAMLHGRSTSDLMKIGQELLTALHTKDIQVYFSDPNAEKLLSATGYDGTIAHGPGDSVTVVDDNVGGNKANGYVAVQYNDSVTLDAQGTATHSLSITYTMNGGTSPLLFARYYYLDYLRMYTPANSQLANMVGFNFTDIGPNQIGHSDYAGRQMWAGYLVVQNDSTYTASFRWSVPNAATRDSTGQWH
ncbi:MAG: DUF4012 domain-containing protein, partial [Ktedonobacterales bacterium]